MHPPVDAPEFYSGVVTATAKTRARKGNGNQNNHTWDRKKTHNLEELKSALRYILILDSINYILGIIRG